ncbi:hypothetical protein [Rhizocola hellebori]|nr:hypothetical protein [Rhizocola hellebori]
MAIAQIAMLKAPVNLPGGVVYCDRVCPVDWYLHGDQVASFDDDILENLAPSFDVRGLLPPGVHPLDDHVAVAYPMEFQNVGTFLRAARQRLATAGWAFNALSDDSSYTSVWAAKDDLVVRVYTTTAPYGRGETALIEVSANFPVYGAAFIGLGFLLSLPAGWALTTRTLQRARRSRMQIKSLIVIAGSLVLPAICIALIGMAVAGFVALTDDLSITDLLLPAATLSVLSDIPVVIPATATAIVLMLLLTSVPLARQMRAAGRARFWAG